MDEKNFKQLNNSLNSIDTILNEWDILELSDIAFAKFFDARRKIRILLKDEN